MGNITREFKKVEESGDGEKRGGKPVDKAELSMPFR